jgi:transcriptional regulator with XRE-family HTH domain
MLRIKEILKQKGLTIQDLANILGISRQALGKQIQGKMLLETAERIATALNVPMWQLFAAPEEVQANPESNGTRIICPHCKKAIPLEIVIRNEAHGNDTTAKQ